MFPSSQPGLFTVLDTCGGCGLVPKSVPVVRDLDSSDPTRAWASFHVLRRGHIYQRDVCSLVSLPLRLQSSCPLNATTLLPPRPPAEIQAARDKRGSEPPPRRSGHSTRHLHALLQPHFHPRAVPTAAKHPPAPHTSRPSHTPLNTHTPIIHRLPRTSPTIVIAGPTHAARSALGDQQHPL